MLRKNNLYASATQNRLVFRTPPGSRHIEAGQTVRLTDSLPDGVTVAGFYTIRVYAVCRPDGTVPVSFYINVLDRQNEELIFNLDNFTVQLGEAVTRTYNVPGQALVVFAAAGEGTGGTGVDFGILGFGPRLRSDVRTPLAERRAAVVPNLLKGVVR